MDTPGWAKHILQLIDAAVSDRLISKEALVEGLEEVAISAEGWAELLRKELEAGE